MADKDKADSKLRFFFYEQRIHSTDQMQRVLATDMGRAAPRNLMTFSIEPKLIQDKWLYIFYSEGAEYAIMDEDIPGSVVVIADQVGGQCRERHKPAVGTDAWQRGVGVALGSIAREADPFGRPQ